LTSLRRSFGPARRINENYELSGLTLPMPLPMTLPRPCRRCVKWGSENCDHWCTTSRV